MPTTQATSVAGLPSILADSGSENQTVCGLRTSIKRYKRVISNISATASSRVMAGMEGSSVAVRLRRSWNCIFILRIGKLRAVHWKCTSCATAFCSGCCMPSCRRILGVAGRKHFLNWLVDLQGIFQLFRWRSSLDCRVPTATLPCPRADRLKRGFSFSLRGSTDNPPLMAITLPVSRCGVRSQGGVGWLELNAACRNALHRATPRRCGGTEHVSRQDKLVLFRPWLKAPREAEVKQEVCPKQRSTPA